MSERVGGGVPPLVERATALAERDGFERSCTPEVGRLLAVLAAGVRAGLVGELGTGRGVVTATAWLASGLGAGRDLLAIDHDPSLAAAARDRFVARPRVHCPAADWRELLLRGPFDLLFVDVEEAKRGDPGIVVDAIRPGEMVVLDDFSPTGQEPPHLRGRSARVRTSWLDHPRLLATELQVAPTMVVVLAVVVAARDV